MSDNADNAEFIREFVVEASEHLEQAEACLLTLSAEPQNTEAVQACFRALHTIKGLAGFLQLERIQALSHAAEQLLDLIRTGKLVCGSGQIDVLLGAISRLGELIKGLDNGTVPDGDEHSWIEKIEAQMECGDSYQPSHTAKGDEQATSRRFLKGAQDTNGPPVIPALDGVLGELVALDPTDVPGLVHLLAKLRAAIGSGTENTARALAEMDGLCEAMINEKAPPDAFERILALAQSLTNAGAPAKSAISVTPQHVADFVSETHDLLARAEAAVLGNGKDAVRAEEIFRSFHTVKGMASYLGFPRLERFAHALETELVAVRDGVKPLSAEITALTLTGIDALRSVADLIGSGRGDSGTWPGVAIDLACKLGVETPAQTETPVITDDDALTVDALVACGISPQVIKEATRRLAKGEDLTSKLVRTGKITQAKAEEVQAKQAELSGKSLGADGFTRVSIGRLEDLVNLVGELLISQSMVNQDPAVRASTRLQSIVSRQNRIVRDLQNLSLGLRMVPLKATFQKMARAVHDTARKVGKPVEFRIIGEDTEIDRTLAETLADPLLHMVRNAVDHGIENAERRRQAGKSEKGSVTLSATQGSDQVIITLADDGGGMDPKKLIAKAVEKGLIPRDRHLSDAEAYQLIFAPGFSTAEQVTGISGRGVGMDVVRRNVEAAKGRIEIDSVLGKGSTFTIRLPLTTAILDAMLLRVGGERFLIPVTAIVASLRPNPGQVQEMFGRGRVIENRGEVLPVATLGELFSLPHFLTDPTTSVVMVIEHQGGRYAIQVDEILGLQQVVIKPLDQDTPHHVGLAGTAILGDGRVGLILDPARLLN